MGQLEQARLETLKVVNEKRLESLDEFVELVIIALTAIFFIIGYIWNSLSNLIGLFSLISTIAVFFFYKLAKALHAIDIRLLVIGIIAQLLAISLLMYSSIPILVILKAMELDTILINILISIYFGLLIFLEEIDQPIIKRIWSFIEITNINTIPNFEIMRKRVLDLSARLRFNGLFYFILAFDILLFTIPTDVFFIQFGLFILSPSLMIYIIYQYYRYRKLIRENLS